MTSVIWTVYISLETCHEHHIFELFSKPKG